MRQKCFKNLSLIVCFLLLVACGSATKKPMIVIEKATTVEKLVLTEAEKAKYMKALDLMAQSAFTEAASIFESLTKAQPKLTGAYVNLGVIRKAENRIEEAEQLFAKALNINPNFVDALLQQALIYQDKGEFSKTEELLRRAEAIQPENPLVNYNLGVLYELYLQEYSLAIKHYKRYVKFSNADDVEIVKRWILLLERK